MRLWTEVLRYSLVLLVAAVVSACGGGGGAGGGSGVGGGGTSAVGSQGTLASPVLLTSSGTYSGTVSVNGPSYYEYTGLTGGATYSVTLSNISSAIFPVFYSSNTTSNQQSCFYSTVTGTASCIVQASPTGNILIAVTDFSLSSASYTISAALAVDPGQGLPTAPVPFALGTTYSGSLTAGVSTTTYDTGNSGYYSLTGLTAYHKYSITLTASAGSASLHAYQSSYSSEAVVACSAGTSCTITAAGTSLLLQVRPAATATFTITATDLGAVTPFSTQGAVGSEVTLPLDHPDVSSLVFAPNGSVNTTKSYYTISRLVPGQRYYTYLGSPGDDVNLYVYTDAAYTKLACSSVNSGTSSEACMATPTASGQLWIVADGSNAQSYLGSTFYVGAKRAPQVQGTSAAPQLVSSTTDLPFRANWTNTATSYYVVTGLPANTTMMVTSQADYTWGSDYGNLSTYASTGFAGGATCQTQNNMAKSYQSCTGTTDGSGNLYVSLDTGWFPALPLGGTAYINVKPVPVNEGTSTAPLAKSMATPSFTGQVAGGSTGNSYYALTGLTANTPYYILGSFGTDGQPAALSVYNTFTSGDLTKETPVCTASWTFLNNGCTATSDANGRLWVQFAGWPTDNGTNFTLEALPVPVNVGSTAAPASLTTLPYRTTVAAAGTSYYTRTGLTIGAEYAFWDSDSSGGEYITVYNDAALTSQVCSTYAMSAGRRSVECRGTSTSGTAYIVVYGGSAASYYSLNIVQVPAFEGTPATPIAYTSAGTLLGGKVNVGASYYKATLSPNTLYTISLSTVAGDPDLQVFNTAAMTGAAACSSIKGQNQAESCQATSDANGNLWITVDGQLSRVGGSYQLKVN